MGLVDGFPLSALRPQACSSFLPQKRPQQSKARKNPGSKALKQSREEERVSLARSVIPFRAARPTNAATSARCGAKECRFLDSTDARKEYQSGHAGQESTRAATDIGWRATATTKKPLRRARSLAGWLMRSSTQHGSSRQRRALSLGTNQPGLGKETPYLPT